MPATAAHVEGLPPRLVSADGLSVSARHQFEHRSIDEGSVFRVEHRVAGAMAPDRRDWPQFGLLHASDLAPVVFNGEIEIGLTRHHGRVGGDRTQCFIEIAAAKLVGADVGVLSRQPHPKAAISAANKEDCRDCVRNCRKGSADLWPCSLVILHKPSVRTVAPSAAVESKIR